MQHYPLQGLRVCTGCKAYAKPRSEGCLYVGRTCKAERQPIVYYKTPAASTDAHTCHQLSGCWDVGPVLFGCCFLGTHLTLARRAGQGDGVAVVSTSAIWYRRAP